MARTPDRFPGARQDDKLILYSADGLQSGSLTFSSGSFFFQYNDGTLTSYRQFSSTDADPVASASEGDRYYNTDLEMEMRYDSLRQEWLSVEGQFITFGRNGPTTAGSYYRGPDGVVQSDVRGFTAMFSGTIVSFGYTMDPATISVFEIMANGVFIGAVTSSVPVQRETDLDIAFSPDDVISFRNSDAGPTTENVTAWARVKWRA